MSVDKIKSAIRDIPNFPKDGIIFKDITPVLQNAFLFKSAINILADKISDLNFNYICGIESRGFIFGAALALKLGLGFIPIRKPGKLPANTYSVAYELEYGSNILEIHKDSLPKGSKTIVVDDLLATGGTAKASVELIEKCNSFVESVLFLVELNFLNGRDQLKNYRVDSIISY